MYRRSFVALLAGGISMALSGCLGLGGGSGDSLSEYVDFEYSLRESPVGVAMEATATNTTDDELQFQLRPEVYTDEGEEPADSRSEFIAPGETLELTIPMYIEEELVSEVTHYIVKVFIYRDRTRLVEYEKRHEDFHERLGEG